MAKRIFSASQTFERPLDWVEERFASASFILTDSVTPPAGFSLGSSFVFDGLIVLICRKGRGTMRINYREYEMTANQILVLMPYQLVSCLERDEEFFVTALFLESDMLARATFTPDYDRILQLGKHPLISLTPGQMENLMELHALILFRYRNLNNPYSEIGVVTLLYSFLFEIAAIYQSSPPAGLPTAPPNRQQRVTEEFFRLLIGNFRTERAVAFYADKLCFTPKYLSTIVKKVTGHPIQEWINEIVIHHAKNQLKTTAKTVLEISEEMNFSNPSFFGRFFKQYTGMTPLEFRNS